MEQKLHQKKTNFAWLLELKILKNVRIKTILISSFLTLSIIPLIIIGCFSYSSAKNMIQDKVGIFSEQLLIQTGENINSKIFEVENLTKMLYANSELNNILSGEASTGASDKLSETGKIVDMLTGLVTSNSDIQRIIIVKTDGETFSNVSATSVEMQLGTSEFQDTDIFKQVCLQNGSTLWVTGLNGIDGKIYIMRKMSNVRGTTAALIVVIDEYILSSIYNKLDLGKEATVTMLDNNRNAIFVTNKDMADNKDAEKYKDDIYEEKLNGKILKDNNLITYVTCSNGWRLINTVPVSSLMKEMYLVGWGTVIIGIICAVLAIIIGITISFNISTPLDKIIRLMKKAEQGDLTVAASINGRNELCELSHSFNTMIHNIRSLINETRKTMRIVVDNSSIINDVAGQSAAASEQVSTAIQEISNGIANQEEEVRSSTDLIEQLVHKIKNMSDNVNMVIEVTGRTKVVEKKALVIVDGLNKSTKKSLEMFADIKDSLVKFTSGTKEIENVVKVIRSISEQTNLIAINAAIEAARAGKAGNSFSVVADEVVKLAYKSKEAARIIDDIINNIQKETSVTVGIVNKGSEMFEEQEHYAGKTIKAFEDVDMAMDSIINQIDKVCGTINEVEQYKDQVIYSIGQISEESKLFIVVTEEVMATSEEQAASSEQLANLSVGFSNIINELHQSIEKFKT